MNITKEELIQMVIDAYNACYSEYMSCPWCSGRIGYEGEWHDAYCPWIRNFGGGEVAIGVEV